MTDLPATTNGDQPLLPRRPRPRPPERLLDALGPRFARALMVYHSAPSIDDPMASLAIVDVALECVARAAAACDSPEFRAVALALYREAAQAFADDHVEAAAKALRKLGGHLERGAGESEAISKLADIAERRSRMLTDIARTSASVGRPVAQHVFGRLCESMIESIHKHADTKVAEAILEDVGAALRGGASSDDLLAYLQASSAPQSDGGAQ